MMKTYILAFVSLLIVGSCTKVPITERRQMNLLPETDLIMMSKKQYAQFVSEHQVIEYGEQAELVARVGQKITNAVDNYMTINGFKKRIRGFEWEYKLVEDPAVNAWCMPGGKICIYTGILDITQDENGLAVVMGHEVAHAIARHGNERMSQGLLVQTGGTILSVALMNKSVETQNLFLQAYGLGAATGVILPFSRKNELESDKLGLVFMQLAGYDASKAPEFWKRMAANGENPPEFFSTHPSDERRVKKIEEFLNSDTFKSNTASY